MNAPQRLNWWQRRGGGAKIAVVAGVIIVLAVIGNNLGGNASGANQVTSAAPATFDSSSTAVISAPPTSSAGASVDGITGETECPAADGSSERVTSFALAPPICIDTAADYAAEVVTNIGTIVIQLDATRAPNTVNNFVVLARYHYYDDVPFHRIIPAFVIQGGDAVGDPLGTGNPGYTVADELPNEGDYVIGSVAMAGNGPDTNGSQFFIITGDLGVTLPPLYSLFGQVIDGLDVVIAIESIPTNAVDFPTEPAVIEMITIIEG